MEFDRFELLHVLADSTNRSLDVLAAHEINGIMAPGDAPLVVLMNQSGVLERSIGERCPNSAKEEGLPYGIGTTTELSLGTTMCNTPLSFRAPRDSSAVAHKDVSVGRPPVRGRRGGGKQLHSDTAQAAHDPSRPEAEVAGLKLTVAL